MAPPDQGAAGGRDQTRDDLSGRLRTGNTWSPDVLVVGRARRRRGAALAELAVLCDGIRFFDWLIS